MLLWTKKRIILALIMFFVIINSISTLVILKYVRLTELNRNIGSTSTEVNNIKNLYSDSVVTFISGIDIQNGYRSDDLMVGTGFIYHNNLVVTNYHTIKDKKFYILDSKGKTYRSRLISFDIKTDIALVEVFNANFSTKVKFDTTNEPNVGGKVYTIGTPLYPSLKNTVVEGMICGVNRTGLHEWAMIQSNIPSSPGMSGSPLINSKGSIIGINTFQISEYGSNAITLAIPADVVYATIKSLEKNEKIIPYTGLVLKENEYANYGIEKYRGLIVEDVEPNSPVDLVKIKPFDRIIEINNEKIDTKADFNKTMAKLQQKGTSIINIKALRQGKEVNFVIKGLFAKKNKK